MTPTKMIRRAMIAAACSAFPLVGSRAQGAAGEWPAYHHDNASTRYSPLALITKENASRLQVAWTWQPDTAGAPGAEVKNENTPLMIGGTLYVTANQQRNVAALDAATGALKWRWAYEETGARWAHTPRPNSGRGVAYWTDGRAARIFVVLPGFRLVALDAAKGTPIDGFGAHGFIDLKARLGLPVDLDNDEIGNSSPPVVWENVVMVGPALREGSRPVSKRNVPGRVLAFDARTGELKWRFNTIPTRGEPGYETWLDGSAEYTGNTGVWAPFSVDVKRGWVYLPVEAPTGDYYGGHRPGNNLFSSTLVCLDARNGKMIWHFQLVHHDIWDRDIPTAPILADVTVGGRKVEAVFQITKQSFVYAFDRVTGKPIWPITEEPVPQTDVPGEWTSPTQPKPSKPAPFDVQGISTNDLIDFTPELRAAAIAAVKPYRLSTTWTPPSVFNGPDGTQGTLFAPGSVGGANWEHGSFDPETGILYVGSFTNPSNFGLVSDSTKSDMKWIMGNGRVPNVQGLPLLKPPYNRITAIDMNTGDHKWMVPGGDTPDNIANNPALKGVAIPVTGARTRPAVMATKTLLFAAEGYGSKPVLHVLDKATGARVADVPVPGMIGGTPMTYAVNGRQYVAVWVGKQGMPATLVALAVP